MNLKNLQKKTGLASVYEFQNSTKKRQDWLQYMNFKSLQKKTVMASVVYEFEKSPNKDGNGFSI